MVATVTNINDAKSKAGYLYNEGYYAKDSPEHQSGTAWFGKAAAFLRLGRTVAKNTFERVLQGNLPNKRTHERIRLGRRLAGKWVHRAGVEITLSAPKSVSIAALVFGIKGIIRCHDEAVRKTLAFIEREFLVTRIYNRDTKEMDRVRTGRMVASLFRHLASRNGDPQLHTHVLVANATRRPDGKWRGLDTVGFHARKFLIGAYYRNELAMGLKDLGFELVPSRVGRMAGFEIRGYSRESIDAFSSRRKDALAWLRENDKLYTPENMQKAVLETRPPKAVLSLTELEAGWLKRAQEAGLTRQGPHRSVQGRANGQSAGASAVPPILDIVYRAVANLEESVSVFPAHDLRSRALAHSQGAYGIEDVDAAIAQLVSGGHLIATPRRGTPDHFVTDRALRSEKEVVRRMAAGIGAARPLASEEAVAGALAATRLTDGQKETVKMLVAAPHRTVGVQGSAGTGKATVLKEALTFCGERRIVGLAPFASAAHTLAREGGLATHTLQWFLARCRDVAEGVAGPEVLKRLKADYQRAVVIVDEMFMVSSAQARDLLRIADRLGIERLALIGDARQLRSVEARQPFRLLQNGGMPTAEMKPIVRQRNPVLRAAVEAAIDAKPARAIEQLDCDVVEVPMAELGEQAARAWLALDLATRETTALYAPTHALNAQITEVVREGLLDEGVLSKDRLALAVLIDRRMTVPERSDGRALLEGDVVLFHQKLDDLDGRRIESGDGCTVTAVEPDGHDFVVQLMHPDGTPRRIRPSDAGATPGKKAVGQRFQVYGTAEMEVRVGDRVRWTRNDGRRGIVSGATGTILAIDRRLGPGRARVTIEYEDINARRQRRLRLDESDPQLKHIRFDYAATAHAGQGATQSRVIGVLDSGHPALNDQCAFYTEISCAQDEVIVFTDSRENLIETLKANSGERLSALEALAEGFDGFDVDLEAIRASVRTRMEKAGSALAKTTVWAALAARAEALERAVAANAHIGAAAERDPGWRDDLKRRADAASQLLARDHRYIEWLPEAYERLRTAVAAATSLVDAHNWVRTWDADPPPGEDDARAAADVKAGKVLLATPALPEAVRDAVSPRVQAASWFREQARLEVDARDRGMAFFDHPELDRLIAAGRRLAGNASLLSSFRAVLLLRSAGLDTTRVERAADRALAALESFDAPGQVAVEAALAGLTRPTPGDARRPPGDGWAAARAGADTIRDATEGMHDAFLAAAEQAARVLTRPGPDKRARERLRGGVRRLDACRDAARDFLAWEARWRARGERCRHARHHAFDTETGNVDREAEALIEEAGALHAAGRLGAAASAYLAGLLDEYGSYRSERKRFYGLAEDLLLTADDRAQRVSDPTRRQYAQRIEALAGALKDARHLTAAQRQGYETVVSGSRPDRQKVDDVTPTRRGDTIKPPSKSGGDSGPTPGR